MRIEFLGAAQTVTGSKHIVRTKNATILLDCGLFQGHRRESVEKNRTLGFAPHEIDAVVLSHAHIDHSGALPVLTRAGYRGPIFATPATHDLCAAMLTDAAMIQEIDARYVNKQIDRGRSEMDRVEPLYEVADVPQTLSQMIGLPYHRRQLIAPGVHVTLLDAGHVLGSAITVLDIEEDGDTKRLVFTGDLGRRNLPILRDPEIPSGAHALMMESTYGDRLHEPYDKMEDDLARLLARAFDRGGKVIIPSFALERAQEILFALNRLRISGRLPKMPVYVDSPLTMRITEVFKLHPECYDADMRALLRQERSPFDFDGLRYIADKEESQALDASSAPSIIISASGMCEGGRVLHHLKATIQDERNVIAIVGFQAQHTLGRRLVERRPSVRIFGMEHPLRAEVAILNGFSAHADQAELLDFAEAVRTQGPLRQVILVHGELKAQKVLAAELGRRHFPTVSVPGPGDAVVV